MAVTIGINGFGRIGRYLTRLLATDPDITLMAINARADNAQLAHLLKYDSVHGRFAGRTHCSTAPLRVGRLVLIRWRRVGPFSVTLGICPICNIPAWVSRTGCASFSKKAGEGSVPKTV